MSQYMVITANGPDQVGIVEQITKILLEYGANVEDSRMARLGGEFAAIILISLDENKVKELSKGLDKLKEIPLIVTSKSTSSIDSKRFEGFVPYEITVAGADQEGIVHKVAHFLSELGINIETLETAITNAPTTGTPLFSMHAMVQSPAKVSLQELRHQLSSIGDDMGTDIEVKMVIK